VFLVCIPLRLFWQTAGFLFQTSATSMTFIYICRSLMVQTIPKPYARQRFHWILCIKPRESVKVNKRLKKKYRYPPPPLYKISCFDDEVLWHDDRTNEAFLFLRRSQLSYRTHHTNESKIFFDWTTFPDVFGCINYIFHVRKSRLRSSFVRLYSVFRT